MLGLRWMIACHPHSGQNAPPMYGDFEAQRHWMEVTYNLPISDWYQNTSKNDLGYWGLDYPPLTAYHSWVLGLVANTTAKEIVQLGVRGPETFAVKIFMRATVLATDLAVLFPATCAYFGSFSLLILALAAPALILIDHGHFQFNGASLGLALLAFSSMKRDRMIPAAIWFSLALNFKQMELYHSLPVFFYMLAWSFHRGRGLFSVSKIGLFVALVFGLMLMPWIVLGTQSLVAVMRRLFPFNRGLYESKVANFWCTINVLYKVNTSEMRSVMVPLCLVTTLAVALPSCVHLFVKPVFRNFKLTLFIVSLSFFLFSYHVHEKSILLAVLPSLMLLDDYPSVCVFFLFMSASSMFPLFVLDELLWAYFGITLIFSALLYFLRIRLRMFMWVVFVSGQFLNLASLFIPPPEKLPDLFAVVISAYSFTTFSAVLVYFYYEQFFGDQFPVDSRRVKTSSDEETKKIK
ncbi:unnamed protein product [Notodromas monacha]|uniref:Alpha-1,3-glucosyltransferase n=1 Tax=Notodromas monacha TaxID=399045 RepID=A0A7R9BMC8_9CRUS|nr:unnamed protein product [Notodromas monacha]CAG0918164.1 unnamed protein product [Notodromas monacha]